MALFGIIPDNRRDQIMFLGIVAAAAWGYAFYTYIWSPKNDKITAARVEIDSLQKIVDAAKRDLASGTVEDLRRKVDQYRADVLLMRRLVPEKNEVPNLIDDVTNKAKLRGVTVGKFQPLASEPGMPFDTYKYRMEVYGHYDQVGEFLTDVASLNRIVVPQDLVLKPAVEGTQRLLRDTVGGLLEADFNIRTYVKSSGPPPAPKGKPAARPAGRPNASQ